jgi:hypothetical protein
MRHPAQVGADEIAQFLSALAIRDRVAASTQNQALSATADRVDTRRSAGSDAAPERHIVAGGNCLKADPAYGKGVADALGIASGELAREV